jgi:hypothetical protein
MSFQASFLSQYRNYFLKDADFKFNLILIVIIAEILFSREYFLLVHGMYL